MRSPVDDFDASVISQIHQQQMVGREPLNSVDIPSALLQCNIGAVEHIFDVSGSSDSGETC